ncbi:MAG: aminomethyl-transferring glycine dehydrogenase subunit GcvPA [Deltaproteobacteria bacterium]|nr:aminomethyl-transferring glycine dehydrogenase subunit GcvPA [Deltaproteobacteria bacterium]
MKEMCSVIGVDSVEDLLCSFPSELLLSEELKLPKGKSEQELKESLTLLSEKNITSAEFASFLGGGSYNHYTPAVVDSVLTKGEFFTAYTPYQPELSQGTLQAIFEYQTYICQLTGTDVSNASLYDGASASAEAVLMAFRRTRRKVALISGGLHPEYTETIETYLGATSVEGSQSSDGQNKDKKIIKTPLSLKSGRTDIKALKSLINKETACVLIQSPNFFGSIEDLFELSRIAHENGALFIVVVTEALSLALLKPPGELGADIVVGEAQSFGCGLNYGGPYLGFMGVKDSMLREMPGRLVGETLDSAGRRSFCLTLATREQHIRRSRATSNICTNQGLLALACTTYLSALGKGGLMRLARLNLSKAEYLKAELTKIKGVEVAFSSPVFNEFTVKITSKLSIKEIQKSLSEEGIFGGLSLGEFYPENKEQEKNLLIAVTEMNSKEEMDSLAGLLEKILKR